MIRFKKTAYFQIDPRRSVIFPDPPFGSLQGCTEVEHPYGYTLYVDEPLGIPVQFRERVGHFLPNFGSYRFSNHEDFIDLHNSWKNLICENSMLVKILGYRINANFYAYSCYERFFKENRFRTKDESLINIYMNFDETKPPSIFGILGNLEYTYSNEELTAYQEFL